MRTKSRSIGASTLSFVGGSLAALLLAASVVFAGAACSSSGPSAQSTGPDGGHVVTTTSAGAGGGSGSSGSSGSTGSSGATGSGGSTTVDGGAGGSAPGSTGACLGPDAGLAGLIADLGFEQSALGTYDCPTSNSIQNPPAPWPAGECQGVGSQIVVYDSTTAQAGWPAPRCGAKAAAFFSDDPDTSTPVARIQLHHPVPVGTDVYAGYYIYAPSSLPAPIKQGQGLTLFQEWYGSPFVSGPAMPYSIYTDTQKAPDGGINGWWYMRRSDPLGWPLLETAMPQDEWVFIVDHVVLSPDPTVGILESWINGVQQTFTSLPRTDYDAGQQIATYETAGQWLSSDHKTLHIATMTTDQDPKLTGFWINNYRHVNNAKNPIPPGDLLLFFDGVRLGTTYASVAP